MSKLRKKLDFNQITKGDLVTRHFNNEAKFVFWIKKVYKGDETFDVYPIDSLVPFRSIDKQKTNIEFKKENWYYFTKPTQKEINTLLNNVRKKFSADKKNIRSVINKLEETLYDLINKKMPADYHGT